MALRHLIKSMSQVIMAMSFQRAVAMGVCHWIVKYPCNPITLSLHMSANCSVTMIDHICSFVDLSSLYALVASAVFEHSGVKNEDSMKSDEH